MVLKHILCYLFVNFLDKFKVLLICKPIWRDLNKFQYFLVVLVDIIALFFLYLFLLVIKYAVFGKTFKCPRMLAINM